jgi:hypothetical protein
MERLDRKPNVAITDELIKKSIESWRTAAQLDTFGSATSSFSEKEKFQWALSHGVGEEVSKRDILNQKYRRYSYAQFN